MSVVPLNEGICSSTVGPVVLWVRHNSHTKMATEDSGEHFHTKALQRNRITEIESALSSAFDILSVRDIDLAGSIAVLFHESSTK